MSSFGPWQVTGAGGLAGKGPATFRAETRSVGPHGDECQPSAVIAPYEPFTRVREQLELPLDGWCVRVFRHEFVVLIIVIKHWRLQDH